ncbi:MAG: tRNA 2-thiouridine(34) synthase MnmA [Solirubrobacterales bacterium]
MSADALQSYYEDRSRRGPSPSGAFDGAAGGAPCGDLVRISLLVREGAIERARFDAEGCAAALAAAAAGCELAEGAALLDCARIDAAAIDAALGGLSPGKRHAAELAADALGRALSALASSGEPLSRAPAAGPERALVALSGGVDSAVAALLERERGAEVVAVTLKLWADTATDGERSCCSPQAVVRARRLAHSLGMPHLTLDLEQGFREHVVASFLEGYAAGETPNPCVRCNGELRIDAMIELAGRLGAGALVTGHYARLADDGEGPLLAAAADHAKDQTHMLAALAPSSLARLRFPLADLRKPEVREIAAAAGLEVAGRPESQDLCFLAGTDKRSFLRRHAGLEDRAGELVDERGEVMGTHPGQHHFTVGQRRGLGLAAGRPLYVLGTDAATNRVVVGGRERLAKRTVRLRDATLHREACRVNQVRLRHHAPALPCRVETGAGSDRELLANLGLPAYGVAPGQTASLLDGELVVGHATIAA